MVQVLYRERDCRPLLRRRRENLEMGHYPADIDGTFVEVPTQGEEKAIPFGKACLEEHFARLPGEFLYENAAFPDAGSEKAHFFGKATSVGHRHG